MNKKHLLMLIFLIFVIGCQKEEVMESKIQPQEKMAAMNVITYDSDKVTVVIDELSFLPAFIHIKKGTTITWENRDKVEHTVAWHNRNTPTQVIESEVLKTSNISFI